MPLDVDEVQGNILHAYGTGCPSAWYLFLRVEEGRVPEATSAILDLIGKISFGRGRDPGKRGVHLNLALTSTGLTALGVSDEVLATFPDDFLEGARKRSHEHVGDRGINASDCWEPGLGNAHVLLAVHGGSADRCERFIAACIEKLKGAMTPVAEPQQAGLLGPPTSSRDHTCGTEFNREHFGFADGCSQPVIEGVNDNRKSDGVLARVPRRGTFANLLEDVGLLSPKRCWRLLAPGEFILGCDDEDGRTPDGPAAPLGPNGTFMVYRKLEQDVETFNDHVERAARALKVDARTLKEKIIGRGEDGRPLIHPDEEAATDAVVANAFTYAEDRWGRKCPLGAHIRRTNPRDALPGGAEVTVRHRMIRRGMPYGPAWSESTKHEERGLIFICYTASIAQGFEFVQRGWCYEGQAFGLDDTPDYILQQPDEHGEMSGSMWIPGVGLLEPPPKPLVTVRGCEYLFVPSRSGCAWIAGLHTTSA